MPQVSRLLAYIVPFVAFVAVWRSLDVTARIQRSWPLALHPDSQEDPAQFPVHVSQSSPPAPAKGHHHHEHPSVSSDTFRRRIVAVGDLHGDLPNAHKVLEMAGVVTDEGHWSGNVDFFVQTGDIIDRGDDTIKLYDWMEELREEALSQGGNVISHLGNHEWMNVIGDWRYVPQSEIKTFGSVAARQKMLMTGRIGKRWAKNYTTTSRLPLHSALGPPNTDHDPSLKSPLSHAAISFVHGGLAPTYPDLTPFPSKINDIGHSLLHKLQHQKPPAPHPPNPYPGLPHDATHSEHRLYGNDGPLWYRGWALDPEQKVCGVVDEVLEKTGTRRMIMGHTPDFERIVSRCGGKIIIIDTGISHAYGGVLAALSIDYTLTPLPKTSGSAGGKRWREREVVTAIYEKHKDVLAVTEREIEGDF